MRVRFNDLPQPVRERFVHMTQAPGRDPRVLVFNHSFNTVWLAYAGVVLSLVAMVPILQFTFTRGQRIDPIHDKEVYLELAAAIAVLVLSISAIVFRLIWKPPPYRQGLYALRSYLVKASGGDLEVTSLADTGVPNIVTVRRNGAHVHTRLELGGPFTFYYPNGAAAQAGWSAIAEARTQFRAMLAARDAAAIASIDPFVECTVAGTWAFPQPQPPPAPRVTPVPMGLAIGRWAVAILLGVVTAGLYYAAIDALFDEDRAIYDKAQRQRFKR
ncbi:hypothetical protein BH11MYX4_BH11MYX4_19660 [soil metagenome]